MVCTLTLYMSQELQPPTDTSMNLNKQAVELMTQGNEATGYLEYMSVKVYKPSFCVGALLQKVQLEFLGSTVVFQSPQN